MISNLRDFQRSAVYAWETEFVSPRDTTPVEFANIQPIVNWIWQSEGLKYPPFVERLPKQKRKAGDATRTCVRFQEKTYTWIILHELAHALSSNVDDETNMHGALFLGLFIQLLSRYLHIPISELAASAESKGLKFKLDARPAFL